MINWCSNIKDAINSDSKWQASIPMPSMFSSQINYILMKNSPLFKATSLSHSSSFDSLSTNDSDSLLLNSKVPTTTLHTISENISDVTNNNNNNTTGFNDVVSISSLSTNGPKLFNFDTDQYIDIVQLIGSSSQELILKLNEISITNGFPNNALFRFDGFTGFNNQNHLIDAIKRSAFKSGTILSVLKNNGKRSNLPYHSIEIGCTHFGKPRKIDNNFLPNKLQAKNTIIQVSHSATSIKNRSRNATYKRVAHDDVNQNDLIKANRTTSKKCSCSFYFTIFYDEVSSFWYLKKKKSYDDDAMYHHNHIWVDPDHLTLSKKFLDKDLNDCIISMINSGSNIPSIQHFLKHQYKVNVDYSTIYNIRNKLIQDIIRSCSGNPSGSAVDRLINLFRHTNSVSFVYIIHRYNTGLVTFRKNRNQSIREYISQFHENQIISTDSKTITNWRDSIATSNKKDVLIAFAWSHDEEIRATEKNPEFLGVDVTFGVNRERRELLLVAGIDGRNRTFTSFRCFIPSKQQQAYTWIMNEAIEHILSPQTLKFNQCITCDQELTLNNSINSSISSSKDSFSFSKMRLDCFHFFNKVWTETVTMKARSTIISSNHLYIMKKWILTWFKYIESEEEFNISYKMFVEYLNAHSNDIGDVATESVNDLLSKIIGKKEYLLHYFFLDVTTFDFVGDSIVEAANYSLKNGPCAVNSKMDLCTSGHKQLQATSAKYTNEIVKSAKRINSINKWSTSNTKAYLTDYAEGIACRNFDNKDNYVKRYIGNKEFLVCSNSLIDEISYNDLCNSCAPITRFNRVRKVTITPDGFITCSCKEPQRWLLPCRHICCVIGDPKFYTEDLFHIRWWKHFEYIFKKGNSSMDEKTRLSLESALKYIRENNYCSVTGKYKGVPITGTALMNYFQSNLKENDIDNDNITIIMSKIWNKASTPDFLLRNSDEYSKLVFQTNDSSMNSNGSDINDMKDDSHSFTNDNDNDLLCETSPIVNNIVPGSQVFSQLSDYRIDMNDTSLKVSNVPNNNSSISYYKQLKPLFNDLVSSIKTKEDFLKVKNQFEVMTFENLKQDRKRKNVEIVETSFLGEQCATDRVEKRHKYRYEY